MAKLILPEIKKIIKDTSTNIGYNKYSIFFGDQPNNGSFTVYDLYFFKEGEPLLWLGKTENKISFTQENISNAVINNFLFPGDIKNIVLVARTDTLGSMRKALDDPEYYPYFGPDADVEKKLQEYDYKEASIVLYSASTAEYIPAQDIVINPSAPVQIASKLVDLISIKKAISNPPDNRSLEAKFPENEYFISDLFYSLSLKSKKIEFYFFYDIAGHLKSMQPFSDLTETSITSPDSIKIYYKKDFEAYRLLEEEHKPGLTRFIKDNIGKDVVCFTRSYDYTTFENNKKYTIKAEIELSSNILNQFSDTLYIIKDLLSAVAEWRSYCSSREVFNLNNNVFIDSLLTRAIYTDLQLDSKIKNFVAYIKKYKLAVKSDDIINLVKIETANTQTIDILIDLLEKYKSHITSYFNFYDINPDINSDYSKKITKTIEKVFNTQFFIDMHSAYLDSGVYVFPFTVGNPTDDGKLLFLNAYSSNLLWNNEGIENIDQYLSRSGISFINNTDKQKIYDNMSDIKSEPVIERKYLKFINSDINNIEFVDKPVTNSGRFFYKNIFINDILNIKIADEYSIE